ncbi:MAG: hypothetical protein BMS9Abin26_0980 [Gammaproteobacteria bacterium]|nr:MAG: hypothetical protein BMS9Abin26_0980 [Gammaproteobacteria bacterium]
MNNKSMAYILILSLAGISATVSAAAYRWVDDEGNVQFTQEPPPQDKIAEKIKTLKDPRPQPASSSTENKSAEAKKSAGDNKAENEKDAKAQAEAEKREKARLKKEQAKRDKKNCARARANKKKLSEHPRIRFIDKKGNVTRLKDEDRLARIKEAGEQIKKLCK